MCKKTISKIIATALLINLVCTTSVVRATPSDTAMHNTAYNSTIDVQAYATQHNIKKFFIDNKNVTIKDLTLGKDLYRKIKIARQEIEALKEINMDYVSTFSEILDNYEHHYYDLCHRYLTSPDLTQREIILLREIIKDLPIGYKTTYSDLLDKLQMELIDRNMHGFTELAEIVTTSLTYHNISEDFKKYILDLVQSSDYFHEYEKDFFKNYDENSKNIEKIVALEAYEMSRFAGTSFKGLDIYQTFCNALKSKLNSENNLIIGDSITLGMGFNNIDGTKFNCHSASWVPKAKLSKSSELIAFGGMGLVAQGQLPDGESIHSILDNKYYTYGRHYKNVVIALSTNDSACICSKEEYTEKLRGLIKKLRENYNIDNIVCLNFFFREKEMQTVSEELGCQFIDIDMATIELGNDGLHPSMYGQKQIAQTVSGILHND